MKRLFTKFFSTSKSLSLEKQAMAVAPKRYFQNNYTECEDKSSPAVPDKTVIAAIFNILENIDANLDPFSPHLDNTIYVGSTGVAYMFHYLSKQPHLAQYRDSFLTKAEGYLKPALETISKTKHRPQDIPGFILGVSGVYAVAAVYFKDIGNEDLSGRYRNLFYSAAEICKRPTFLRCGSDELFVGRAGYVAGALWMAKQTNTEIHKLELYEICNVIVQSGRSYSGKSKQTSPLMFSYYDVEYLGAAHGLCSILQTLMSVPGYLENNPKEAHDIKASVDYLLSLQDKEGNFPCATDEIKSGRNELVHWCHGAPGVIYMIAKAYLIWKDNKYLKSCEKSADLIWQKGLLRKGPGICHGVAGNGYTFLLMYRLTGDIKYLHRAVSFAKFMEVEEFKHGARVPDNPYSLYEGIAGTACFLNDLLVPDKAAFPFSDIF